MFGRLLPIFRKERAATTTGGGVVDYLAPDGWKEEPDLVQLGPGQFVRALFVSEYPETLWPGWLEPLYGGFEGVDLSIYLAPEETMQRDESEAPASRRYAVGILLAVSAPTREALEMRCAGAAAPLRERMVDIRSLFLRQGAGLVAVAPGGDWSLGSDCTRSVTLDAVVTLYPFMGADLVHPRGIWLGVNRVTGNPVVYDGFAGPEYGVPNPHAGVVAGDPSGERFLKTLAARSALMGISVAIIDTRGRYATMAEGLGGHVIRLRPEDPVALNPMDLEVEEADPRTLGTVNLPEKVADLRRLMGHLLAAMGMDLEEGKRAELDRLLLQLYTQRGITHHGRSLYAGDGMPLGGGAVKKPMPSLRDLQRLMAADPEWAELALPLAHHLGTGVLRLVDVPEGNEPEIAPAHLLVLDLSELEPGTEQPLAVHVLLQWLWEKVVKKRREAPGRLIIDAGAPVLHHPEVRQTLEELMRRSRSRRYSVVLGFGGPGDLAADGSVPKLLERLGTQVLFPATPEELTEEARLLRLGEGERRFLAGAKPHDALLRVGGQAVAMRMEWAPGEWDLLALKRDGGIGNG